MAENGIDIGDQVWRALNALNQAREQMRGGYNTDKYDAIAAVIDAFLSALANALNPE